LQELFMTEHFDLNTWTESYKEAFTSFGKAQQDGFKALERFARFNYAVAGDVLEAGIAQARAALAPKVASGTQTIAELLQKQADLGTELSERLQARAEEFTAMAADVQHSVGSYAAHAATRATRATRSTRAKRRAA
jgi:hypothetical protein